MVPREYPNECIVARPTPYLAADEHKQGNQARRGMLDIGRVVWTKDALIDPGLPDTIPAFVHGVGAVEVDPRCLKAN